MLSQKEIDSVLANEILMWERYTDQEWHPGGGEVTCTLKPGIMPDDNPCRGLIKAKSKLSAAKTWYDFVRGQYDARTAKQEAEAAQRAETSRTSSGEEDRPAKRHGGSKVTPEEALQASETPVEKLLETKIASLGRSIASFEKEIERKVAEVGRLESSLSNLKLQKAKAIAAYKAMTFAEAQETDAGDTDAS